MNPIVQPDAACAMTERLSVRASLHSISDVVVAEFATVTDALNYPAHNLPSGSKVVDAEGRIRARLVREYSPAGRPLAAWVMVFGGGR